MASSTLPLPILLISSLIMLPFCVLSQTRTSITIGDSLYAETTNSTWLVSPSGDFAFGFLPINNNTNLFLLSIWYAKIPEKTIVWFHVNKDSPPAPKGSKVNLTTEGFLLTDPNGELLWRTQSINGVAQGALNDTGNFVHKDGSSGSVWETFDDPRDTLLPSQILVKGKGLSSRLMESNFSLGRFVFLLQDDGNLVMHSINLTSEYANENYYTSQTSESDTWSPGTQLVFDRSGEVYVLRKNKERFNLFNLSDGSRTLSTQSYLRATLNFDGVFTVYEHPRNSSGGGGWIPVWSIPDNICTSLLVEFDSGVCGYNSICTLKDDKRPNCQCPERYSLIDRNNPYGSCKPDFVQGCEEDELSNSKALYEFEVLTNIDWPVSDSMLQTPFTVEQCKQSGMENCMCSIAIFRSGDHCWMKKLPLSNGKYDPTLNGAQAFMKVKKDNSSLISPLPPTIVNKYKKTSSFVGFVLLGGSAFLILILIGATCLSTFFVLKYKQQLRLLRRASKSIHAVETNLRCFTYKEVEEATNGFEKEIGRGTFGIVYEGVISIGSTTRVAVKKLKIFLLQEFEKEFKNELKAIGLTHHKNLVRMLGFCEDGGERMLVYEYMTNGTLVSLLFNENKPDWKLRQQIAIGVARGLLYLHEECNTRIIHCDIKPQNILLDDYYNPRISDFGLAKLLNMNQSRTSTAIRGTRGYVALEWFKNMPITTKVDVYSYGVLLLEITCCRRNVEVELEDDSKAILTEWAYDCYIKGVIDALVENDKEALDDNKNLEKLVMIAIWCVQDDPQLRPTMRNVIQMLEGVAEVQDPPCPSQISREYWLNVSESKISS